MKATMGDWIGVALVLGIALAIFLLKFCFIKCYFNRVRTSNNVSWLNADMHPRRDIFRGQQYFFHPDFPIPVSQFDSHTERNVGGCFGKGKPSKPPPSFEKALRCSTPVVHVFNVEVLDDEPPPSYEECQSRASQAQPASSSSSVNAQLISTRVTIEQQPEIPCSSSQVSKCTRTIINTEV